MEAQGCGLLFAGLALFIVLGVLLSRRSRAAGAPAVGQPETEERVRLQGDGSFGLEVVGESQYQENIDAVAGPKTPDGVDVTVPAELILEDDNLYDSNAVAVRIGGRTVGYLARQEAKDLREELKPVLQGRRLPITVEANIRGGWDRGGGDEGSYGVWLDAFPRGEDAEASETAKPKRRRRKAPSTGRARSARTATTTNAPYQRIRTRLERVPAAAWEGLLSGAAVSLVPFYDDPENADAIRVTTAEGLELGFLPKRDSMAVSGSIILGCRVEARVASVAACELDIELFES